MKFHAFTKTLKMAMLTLIFFPSRIYALWTFWISFELSCSVQYCFCCYCCCFKVHIQQWLGIWKFMANEMLQNISIHLESSGITQTYILQQFTWSQTSKSSYNLYLYNMDTQLWAFDYLIHTCTIIMHCGFREQNFDLSLTFGIFNITSVLTCCIDLCLRM